MIDNQFGGNLPNLQLYDLALNVGFEFSTGGVTSAMPHVRANRGNAG